ncbi:hypothetical protein M0805_009493 [Coniferiporia weirii]|nr:hypothetical protein M0805_009493 [Coniferiporia weirii]
MFPSSSPSAKSPAKGVAPNRLTKSAMSSFNRHSMVDTTTPAVAGPRQNTHNRASSFLNFSFRGRTSSNAQLSQTLPPVRESSANGSNSSSRGPDEFGASHTTRAPPRTLSGPASHPVSGSNNGSNNANGNMTGASTSPPPAPAPARQLHPEIRSIVQLTAAHAHKVYFSGPLVKHVERHSDGRFVGKEEPWREVWAQLGGTTLSVWDMKEIEEANKRGAEVPPTYLNITDASTHVLGAVTMPGPDGTPVKYANVVTVTTAGLNLLLFSCPSPQALISWTAAFRLAAYEKSRLEELYTAHLLRMSLSEQGVWKDPRCPLVNGRLEGWVKIRINGQTDWKRLWMSAQAERESEAAGGADAPRKNRVSALFGRASHEMHSDSTTSLGAGDAARSSHLTLYASAKPRDRRRPILTLGSVSQVFAVYPERPELISRSTILKLEGFIGDGELAGEWRNREGWLLMMPETEPGKLGSLEMLKWLVGLHDAFNLYGRPTSYTWNPRDPASLMFAYPIGPRKDNLFLDRELAEQVDAREDRGSEVRQKFKDILVERMFGQEGSRTSMSLSPPVSPPANGSGSVAASSAPPSLPPIRSVSEREEQEPQQLGPQDNGNANGDKNEAGNGNNTFQLPPLSFDNAPPAQSPPAQSENGSLSPVAERNYEQSRGSTHEYANVRSPPSRSGTGFSSTASGRTGPMPATNDEGGVLGGRRVGSPTDSAPSYADVHSQEQPAGPSSPRISGQAPRFSQSSISASISGSGSRSESLSILGPTTVSSPTRGTRSPPVPPQSPPMEGPRYGSPRPGTDPAAVQLPTSGTQTPASERKASLSVNVQSSGSPSASLSSTRMGMGLDAMMGAQHEYEQVPLSPASHISHSTTLTSPFSMVDGVGNTRASLSKDREREADQGDRGQLPPPPPPEKNARSTGQGPQYGSRVREAEYVFDEPGALYYMHQQRQEANARAPARDLDGDEDEDEDDDDDESEHSILTNPMSINSSPQQQRPRAASPPTSAATSTSAQQRQQPRVPNNPVSPVARRQTPAGFELVSGSVGGSGVSGSAQSGRTGSLSTSSVRSGGGAVGGLTESQASGPRALLTRRPSGARAPPPPPRVAGKRFLPGDSSSSSMPLEVDEHQPNLPMQAHASSAIDIEDGTVDALAALSFLEQQDDAADAPARVQAASPAFEEQRRAPMNTSASVPPQIMEPEDRAPSPPSADATKQQYRSSFAPSRQAAERKARSQAQQAAHDEAVHKPGRPNGRQQRTKQREGGWESSEDEEEEEEEEDDDDVNSDDEPRPTSRGGPGAQPIAAPVGRNPVYQQQIHGVSPSGSGSAVDIREQQQGQQRATRTLPQIPRGLSPAGSERRYMGDQYEGQRDNTGRLQSQYAQQYQQQQHPNASRQNMWSSVLDAGRDTGLAPPQGNNNRDTFVQMESPAETMTKAFTPQGLLSAGLQDKQDRSAKRQEELARESGASLINVPHKPPPPQVGLLGAITAHERERKREGGMGATLTEREREKRLAEDRQRRLDELQRQQLEQQQQLASQFGGGMGMYGGGGLTPQMTGMNPMMGGFGYPQMMGGPQSMYFNPMFNPMMANPQHMFAAQQAAQAYQQAMIAMSTAGSQVGGEGGGGGASGGPGGSPNLNPMGMGGGTPSPNSMMAGGMGYDPRMSMMGMGMMGPPMGMMGMGMPGMGSPMGMQMTGGSNMGGANGGGMDPRFSLGPNMFDGATQGPSSGQQSQHVSPYNGTPSPRASPAPGPNARSGDVESAPRA